MDDKNELVLVVRDKLQSGKKQCGVMHNNFVKKITPKEQSALQNNSDFMDKMEASDLILPMLLRNLLCPSISSPELFKNFS